ncbi:glycerol-3-phosphate transporter periplasmic binding protein [Kluyvera cryocrescens]|uniref:Glycerol-3-phosphate transporter periplasmic binding protein n=1 Tax=Kluyvera cryocrescens TaxID=580 RepID=A0A485AU39_KLUCR|nr:glycerol-3-phosphate transporter periplasmic binding protein [Kluyvera cryocrescens]
MATKNNGFDGTDAVLEFNKPEQVKHIALLEALNKKGDFSYFGRKDESTGEVLQRRLRHHHCVVRLAGRYSPVR